jgi:hypothetical protein
VSRVTTRPEIRAALLGNAIEKELPAEACVINGDIFLTYSFKRLIAIAVSA